MEVVTVCRIVDVDVDVDGGPERVVSTDKRGVDELGTGSNDTNVNAGYVVVRSVCETNARQN